MFKVETITKDWEEAGSLQEQINLFGFWDEHAFLTKSGDLGAVMRVSGMDYESLDHAGLNYAVKRLEAALRSLDEKTRVYQVLFRRNRPDLSHGTYENPLVSATVEQRAAFLEAKADRLYAVEIFWIVMIDGQYAKTGLLHALSLIPTDLRGTIRELHQILSGSRQRTLLYDQIERARLILEQKIQSLTGQLNDLIEVELLGAEKTQLSHLSSGQDRLFRLMLNRRKLYGTDGRTNSKGLSISLSCAMNMPAHGAR